MVANFSDKPLIIPKPTVIGIAEQVSEALVKLVKSGEQSGAKPPTAPSHKKGNETLYSKLLQGKLDHLSQGERRLVEPVLLKYAHVFHDEE